MIDGQYLLQSSNLWKIDNKSAVTHSDLKDDIAGFVGPTWMRVAERLHFVERSVRGHIVQLAHIVEISKEKTKFLQKNGRVNH